MKKWRMIGGLLAFWLVAGSAGAQGIHFEQGTYAQALAKAKGSGKLLFVDAFTTWCGPCKWMAANAFKDPKVGAYFNEHFVSFTYDMEKGDGPQFAQKYGITAYPTLFFLAGDGSVVLKEVGAQDAQGLLDIAQKAEAKAGPRPATEPRELPKPGPQQGVEKSGNAKTTGGREYWVNRLEDAIADGDEDHFMQLGEELLLSEEADRDWLFVVAQRQWLEAGRDTGVFVENLFFWAETSGTEDAEALTLAADLILENVDDASLWGFAELWKEEAQEMTAMKDSDREFDAWEEEEEPLLEEGEHALPAETWGAGWTPVVEE